MIVRVQYILTDVEYQVLKNSAEEQGGEYKQICKR